MTTLTQAARPAEPPLHTLDAQLTGRVVRPEDPDFGRLATPWNVAVPSTPAAVVEVENGQDVSAAVRFAAQHQLSVDVRATGHGPLPIDAIALLIHTGRLNELTVDPSGWARVGAGVRWSELLDALAPHDFGALVGSAPNVGVVGYLTGGGLSPLARTYGIASDYVRAFEVVTGDGVLRRASPHENADLFWGLRGGKGALGIVTAVELDLLPSTEIFGGCLYFDGADAADVLHAWREWSTHLPEQATTSTAVLRLPPMPGIPEPLAGRCTVAVRFAWVGDPAEGQKMIAPLQSVASPIFGGLGSLPFTALGMIHSDPVDPMPSQERNVLLHAFPAEALDALLAVAGPNADSPQVIVEIRQLGGAIARPPINASAVDHRTAAFSLLLIGLGVPPFADACSQHALVTLDAMAAWSAGCSLPNFGRATNVTAKYTPPTLSRLGELVRRYDPNDVLLGGRAVRRATA